MVLVFSVSTLRLFQAGFNEIGNRLVNAIAFALRQFQDVKDDVVDCDARGGRR